MDVCIIRIYFTHPGLGGAPFGRSAQDLCLHAFHQLIIQPATLSSALKVAVSHVLIKAHHNSAAQWHQLIQPGPFFSLVLIRPVFFGIVCPASKYFSSAVQVASSPVLMRLAPCQWSARITSEAQPPLVAQRMAGLDQAPRASYPMHSHCSHLQMPSFNRTKIHNTARHISHALCFMSPKQYLPGS